MAKQITQETFDAVVKENIDDFDMEVIDAVQDAVNQFEAQGVNLNNIVRDLSLCNGDSTHPVLQAVASLQEALKASPVDIDTVTKYCTQIKTECDIDLAHKCLAEKNSAYPILFQALCATEYNNVHVLEAICSLCNGQPDLLDDSSRRAVLLQLKTHSDVAIVLLLVRFIRFTCIKHETNRRSYVGDGLIQILADMLDKHRQEAAIVKEVCGAYRVLTYDDDIRVPFGSAHDHAKMIVTEAGALQKIMEICKGYIENRSVLGELFSTLACLVVRNEFCQEIIDLGGLELMIRTLETNINHPGITKQVLGVLKAIAGNDDVKIAIVNHNGSELILSAIDKHIKQPTICEIGCAAIATIVLRNPSNCARVMQAGAADVLVKVLQLHPTSENGQKQACMAIRNLVGRTNQYRDLFLELGVEPLIKQVYVTHKSCHDEAQAALRDLGCKVELKELWKGEGKDLQRD